MAILGVAGPNVLSPITDSVGQVYSYYRNLRNWVQTSAAYGSGLVSFVDDGLINPEIARLVELIGREKKIKNFNGVKFLNNPDAYWYLLKTSNFLELLVEDPDVRIEINNRKLLRMIMGQTRCKGPTGARGIIGKDGSNGNPGPSESIFPPQINGSTLTVNAPVLTPLQTPVSLRIFNNTTIIAEVRLTLDGNFIFPDSTVVLNENDTKLTLANNMLIGHVVAVGQDWPSGVTYKVRQVGPVGVAGVDGKTFLSIKSSEVTGDVFRATSVIKSVRAGRKSTISYLTGQVNDVVPILHLRNNQDSSFIVRSSTIGVVGGLRTDLWASVDPTTQTAKSMARWALVADVVDKIADVVLDFPNWQPMKILGYPGWMGFDGASDIPDCAEPLFVCLTPLEPPVCPDNGTGPDGTLPDGTLPDGTSPDGTLPDGTLPDGTFPDGTLPDGTGPDGTFPDGTLPDGTSPAGTLPDGTGPNGTLPNGTGPNGTEPNGTGPDGTSPPGGGGGGGGGDTSGTGGTGTGTGTETYAEFQLFYGILKSLWTPGTNFVSLTPNASPTVVAPIQGAPDVSVAIQYPLARSAVSFGGVPGDILAYVVVDAVAMLFSPPLFPRPGLKYQVLQLTDDGGSQNVPPFSGGHVNWDWVHAHGGSTPS